MYDRLTDTYWTQIGGLAVLGELTGTRLAPVSVDTVRWREWKSVHPDSEVLSRDTGYSRRYGRDPYGDYYENSFLMFPVEDQDDRIHPKSVVFGIEVDGVYKAYRENDVQELGTIEDEVNGRNLLITGDQAGAVEIIDTDSGEEIIKERDFWFAWYAFHPDTLLYER